MIWVYIGRVAELVDLPAGRQARTNKKL